MYTVLRRCWLCYHSTSLFLSHNFLRKIMCSLIPIPKLMVNLLKRAFIWLINLVHSSLVSVSLCFGLVQYFFITSCPSLYVLDRAISGRNHSCYFRNYRYIKTYIQTISVSTEENCTGQETKRSKLLETWLLLNERWEKRWLSIESSQLIGTSRALAGWILDSVFYSWSWDLSLNWPPEVFVGTVSTMFLLEQWHAAV